MDSALYINDCRVGEWKYGYSTFEYDVTDALREGENLLVMRVVHQSPNSRWYSGAGIYRNVWLVTPASVRSQHHPVVPKGIFSAAFQYLPPDQTPVAISPLPGSPGSICFRCFFSFGHSFPIFVRGI